MNDNSIDGALLMLWPTALRLIQQGLQDSSSGTTPHLSSLVPRSSQKLPEYQLPECQLSKISTPKISTFQNVNSQNFNSQSTLTIAYHNLSNQSCQSQHYHYLHKETTHATQTPGIDCEFFKTHKEEEHYWTDNTDIWELEREPRDGNFGGVDKRHAQQGLQPLMTSWTLVIVSS